MLHLLFYNVIFIIKAVIRTGSCRALRQPGEVVLIHAACHADVFFVVLIIAVIAAGVAAVLCAHTEVPPSSYRYSIIFFGILHYFLLDRKCGDYFQNSELFCANERKLEWETQCIVFSDIFIQSISINGW